MTPVSVIIPTFNRAHLLPRAVHSVLQQKNYNGELIIVDDGSTDNTGEVVNSLCAEYSVKFVQMHNRGPGAARNRGAIEANHEFLAFLDSDDHWHRDKLQKQLGELLANRQYQISHTQEKWLRRGMHLNQKTIHQPSHGYIFNHCLKLCAVGMSTVIMEKKLFLDSGGFDESLKCCEDYDLWLRLSSKHHFLLIPEALTIKEGGREDQVSFQYRVGMDRFRIYAIEKLLTSHSLSEEQYASAVKELQKKCRVYGNGCIKHGKVEEGEKYLKIPDKYIL